MTKKFTVPARLKPAAEELKNNTKILLGCSPEIIEVIELANNQKVLMLYGNLNRKWPQESSTLQGYYAYCLPDDVEIVADPVSRVPEWVSKKYTVCEVQNHENERFKVTYPNGYWRIYDGLPAALRCDGWIFKGWLHEDYNYVDNCPLMFNTGRDFWRSLSESRDLDVYMPSTAYATVWQKAGKK
jgi:hypothetical protein